MKLVWLILCVALTGCGTKPVHRPVQTAKETGKIVSDHKIKDAVIVKEADAIDAIAPEAKPHTDAQRAAVIAAPAEQIAGLARTIASLESTVTKQAERIAALQDAELRAQVNTMRWFGFGCILAAAALGYARQIQFAVLAAGSGFLSLALAQLWASVASHPAFKPTIGGLVVLGLVGFGWAAFHAYKKGDLAKKTEREAARLKDTLSRVVPVLDDAYDNASDSIRGLLDEKIFKALGNRMSDEHKSVIKELRAKL
jgi:hypothetical protein